MVWLLSNGLYILLAISCAVTFLWLFFNREKLKAKWYALLIISVLHIIYGLTTVKVFAFLETAGSKTSGNMSIFGAVFFMPIAYFIGALIFRRKISLIFDIFTVPLLATLFCARLNCFLTGYCTGTPIPFMPDVLWPVRGTELIFYAVMLEIFAVRIRKNLTHGEVYPIYMISYGIFRFITQFWRAEYFQLGPLHLSHYWAILSVVVGTVILIIVQRSHNKFRL